jgi:hypothetical protein
MPALLFPAIACDYDGTLAVHDGIPPGTVTALGRARAAGIALVLATGRTLFELTRVCEHLDLFDAVVAENGGVLYFPRDRAMRVEGPAPPPRLLEELDRRDVPFQAGRVVVATLHEFRDMALEAVRAAGVTVDVVTNRAALMLLPPLISKGSGVTSALLALGVAPRDVLAIGDADNDLALFDACGWSACPDDALVDVKRRVDWILPGGAGDGVGTAITERILAGKLPPPRHGQHFVHLGWVTATSDPVEIPGRGVNVLVQGDSLCGKSSFVGGLAERLAAIQDTVCVIDPEGDYGVLGQLPRARVVPVSLDEHWADVVDALMGSSPVVADLSVAPHSAQVALAASGLARLRRARERFGMPHWIVVDEAHYLLHRSGIPAASAGFEAKGVCLATYRASWLPPAVCAEMDVFVMGRTTDPDEVAFLRTLLHARGIDGGVCMDVASELAVGTFALVRPGSSPVTFVPPPRAIRHVRHRAKYLERSVAPHRHFRFLGANDVVVKSVGTLEDFAATLGAVPASTLAHHARHGDFSRWIRDVFRDDVLADRVAKLERRSCRGDVPNFGAVTAALIMTALAASLSPVSTERQC